MTVFLEYLEEAYSNATELREDLVKVLIIPTFKKLQDDYNWHDEDILTELVPKAVHDYFANNFERCFRCQRWERRELLKNELCEVCYEKVQR